MVCSPPGHDTQAYLPHGKVRTQMTRPSAGGWYYPSVSGGSGTLIHCVTLKLPWLTNCNPPLPVRKPIPHVKFDHELWVVKGDQGPLSFGLLRRIQCLLVKELK